MRNQQSRERVSNILSVVILGDRDETSVLALAASLARTVDEALSAAIVEMTSEVIVALGHVDHVQLMTAKGVAGSIDGHAVLLGTSSFLSDLGICVGNFGEWAERTAPQGQSVMFVAVDGQPAGFFRLSMNY